ncbi:hypothetical protein DEU56DRAFT_300378 [Suillus clintonianus]|uniref:uncharacterized protein n=1 Tax=Suillus clintonianus TaxID=1904413 RepID=UPI001B8680BA|nr:uncharacterized protein DEU56DRAFT_300378 [Suillus clintonianus]KAG2139684.1 hypothetical protein DEU56DRAFT_300378 [Suillus clintonianus]
MVLHQEIPCRSSTCTSCHPTNHSRCEPHYTIMACPCALNRERQRSKYWRTLFQAQNLLLLRLCALELRARHGQLSYSHTRTFAFAFSQSSFQLGKWPWCAPLVNQSHIRTSCFQHVVKPKIGCVDFFLTGIPSFPAGRPLCSPSVFCTPLFHPHQSTLISSQPLLHTTSTLVHPAELHRLSFFFMWDAPSIINDASDPARQCGMFEYNIAEPRSNYNHPFSPAAF